MVGENKMSLNGLGRLILCMSSRIGGVLRGAGSQGHNEREVQRRRCLAGPGIYEE